MKEKQHQQRITFFEKVKALQRLGLLWTEATVQVALMASAAVPVIISIVILVTFGYETWKFLQNVSLWQFLTDDQWTPTFAQQSFGVMVLASATVMIGLIAIVVATPLGLLAAIYLHEYAPKKIRRIGKASFESLAGIPTIVYGYFALLWVTPFLQGFIPSLNTFNSLSAGIVTGILITPIISSIGEDVLASVPPFLREGGYALGFTKREILTKIVIPMATPGFIAAITLALSRALGETMIAAIAAGQTPKLTANPLIPVSSITAFIVQVSLGDVRPNTIIYHTIFAVGFVLFLITLSLNGFGHWLVQRHNRMMTSMTMPTAEQLSDIAIEPVVNIQHLPPVPPVQATLRQRQWGDRLWHGLSAMAIVLGVLIFVILLATTLQAGWREIDGHFLTATSSRRAAEAGIGAAFMGTVWLLGLTALIAFPIGVGAAIFLEEYLPYNRFNQLLEIHIANLAAVPAILYGLMGLAIFAQGWSDLTGGRSLISAALVLSMIVLPIVMITTRNALRTVPDSDRQAAHSVGMSRWQTLWHIVLPAAFPRIITGLLLSISRAIGETAPLLPIGAVAFSSNIPVSWQDLQRQFTTLTTQIFYWVSRPQPEFHALAAATIIILGALVLAMNILAVYIRDRYRSL